MTPTPFIKLAERIADNIKDLWGCCHHLRGDSSHFFESFFKPTYEEQIEYNHSYYYWMGSYNVREEHNNELRILALLFADQLWQDKPNRKYERK